MKKHLQTLAIGLAIFWFAATAPAQSTLNINLSNDSGNTKVSLNWTGDIVNGGVSFTEIVFPILWHSFGGVFKVFVVAISGNHDGYEHHLSQQVINTDVLHLIVGHNFKSASVTAPGEALVTVWAYLAELVMCSWV